MGIEGRDYYRQSSNYTERLTGWGWRGISPACKWIIAINVIVFLLQIFVTRPARPSDFGPTADGDGEVQQSPDEHLPIGRMRPRVSLVEYWFQLETTKVLHGQIWRLLTHAFCHDRYAIWHLLFNMLFFWWFGPTLESMYGTREFALFYLTAAVVAGLAFVGLDLITGESAPAIGASGAVMAVTMLYAIHYPRQTIVIMLFIPIEIRWLVVAYVIFDLHPVLLALARQQVHTGVAHAAHLGGLAFGFIYWKSNIRLDRWIGSLRLSRLKEWFAPRPAIRVYRPEVSNEDDDVVVDSESQVDDVLRKINEH